MGFKSPLLLRPESDNKYIHSSLMGWLSIADNPANILSGLLDSMLITALGRERCCENKSQ